MLAQGCQPLGSKLTVAVHKTLQIPLPAGSVRLLRNLHVN